jgi:hypothetical protein
MNVLIIERLCNFPSELKRGSEKEQLCPSSFIFTVQLRLASPGLLHDKKIEKWAMKNRLHRENSPEVK